MNVLLIGSGGREHAIAWKLKKDNPDIKLFCAPGNGGTALIGENIDIAANDLDKLLAFAQENEIELTIVGSEEPLTLGICDLFEKNKLRIFGPNKAAARLEGSKGFAKRFMRKYDIPTAKYQEYGNFFVSGSNILSSAEYPIVIKADGLAAGKGVKVCQNKEEALEFAREMFAKHDSVVLEERLTGWEVSLLVFTDGRNYRVMPPSMDHKRAFDNDQGDNTGGMGAISPVPKFTDSLRAECERIIDKTLSGLRAEGIIYRGVLYFGLMITDDGPKVIEYNCRFGDPETQAILPRLKNNLLDIMFACIGGTVSSFDSFDLIKIDESEKAAVCVVTVSGGYPGEYEKGFPIAGLEKINESEDLIIFHAGTKLREGIVITDGGRVLAITALADSLQNARAKAYAAVGQITFKGARNRTDIGKSQL